jgi:hypothetical protein
MENQKVNENCNCKSGKKYKKCCRQYYLKGFNKNQIETIQEIIKYIPNEKIEISLSMLDEILIDFIDKKADLTILKETTIEQIKRHIDLKINTNFLIDTLCEICEDTKYTKTTSKVGCSRCAKKFCMKCYFNMFRINLGISKCPFCRFEFGMELPKEAIEEYILMMKDNCNGYDFN